MKYGHKEICYGGMIGYFLVECLYEGVLACLNNNNKDDFGADISNILDVCFEYFLLAHP